MHQPAGKIHQVLFSLIRDKDLFEFLLLVGTGHDGQVDVQRLMQGNEQVLLAHTILDLGRYLAPALLPYKTH